MKVGYVYDPIYLRHDTGEHVENAERLKAILSHLEETGLKQKLILIKPRPATLEELLGVHHRQHITQIQEVALRGGGWLDVDTVMSADSYQAALYAAGGVIVATDAVITGKVNRTFALVRPPGHHASHERAMGFCLFNNIAIAVKQALAKYNLERVLIIDFDVHHGNGTQEAFYDNPQVAYFSTHQHPHYPGTGSIEEIGKGNIVNVPLPPYCGDAEYYRVYEEILIPVVRRFEPNLIMVSAGYDSHWADGLSMMQLTVTGFARLVRVIKDLADEVCDGRLVLTLEGGYHLQALAAAVKATFDVLLGNSQIDDPLGESPRRYVTFDITPILKAVKEIHQLL